MLPLTTTVFPASGPDVAGSPAGIAAGRHAWRQVPGEVDRRGLADLRDAEAVQDLGERPAGPRPLDRGVEVLGAPAREAVQPLELVHGQGEEVGAALDHAALEELG